MATDRDIAFRLSATDGASSVFDTVRKAIADLNNKSTLLGATLGSLTWKLAAALSVGAIVSFTRSTIGGVSALRDLSDATGATVENLSALENIANRSGIGLDDVGSAVLKLNKALNEARPGSQLELTFKSLGLSVKQLKDLDPAIALQELAKAFANFADDAGKGRAVLELTGKSAKEIAPVFKALSEAGTLVAKVTTEQANAAKKFDDELAELSTNAKQAARALLGDLVPAMNEVFKGAREQGGFWRLYINTLKKDLDNLPSQAEKDLEDLRLRSHSLQMAFRTLNAAGQQLPPDEVAKLQQIDDRIAQIARNAFRTAELIKGRNEIANSVREIDTRNVPLPALKVADAAELEKARLAYKEFIATVKDKIEASNEEAATGDKITASRSLQIQMTRILENSENHLSQAQKATLNAYLDAGVAILKSNQIRQETSAAVLKSYSEEAKQIDDNVEALQEQITSRQADNVELARQIELQGKSAIEQEALRLKWAQTAVDVQKALVAQAVAAGDPIAIEGQKALLAIMQQVLDKKAQIFQFDATEATNPLAGAQRGVQDYLETVSNAGKATRDAVGQAIKSLEDGLTSLVVNGKLDFRSLVNSILADALRLNVIRPFLASLLGAGGLLTTGLTGLFGGARAGGGPVDAGRAYLVGERGPELFMPGKDGQITSNDRARSWGGGFTLVQNNNFSGGANRAEWAAFGLQVRQATLAAVDERQVRGLR